MAQGKDRDSLQKEKKDKKEGAKSSFDKRRALSAELMKNPKARTLVDRDITVRALSPRFPGGLLWGVGAIGVITNVVDSDPTDGVVDTDPTDDYFFDMDPTDPIFNADGVDAGPSGLF